MMRARSLSWMVVGVMGLGTGLWSACKSKEKLPDLGSKLTGPIDVVTAPSGKYFYVMNSDFERRYGAGSIVLVDPDATDGNYKKAVFPTRRLGRSMYVAQNLMLNVFDDPEKPNKGFVELWSLADETQPSMVRSWQIECSPLNGIIAPSKSYLAVGCTNGDLYMGAWSGDPGSASLERTRSYGYEHRALYFYEGAAQTWLLGFPSDAGTPDHDDFIDEDRKTYIPPKDDAEEQLIDDQPNTIPDRFEETAQGRRKAYQGRPYQMFYHNVTQEENESAALIAQGNATIQHFRYLATGETVSEPTLVDRELNYVHYVLREANGQPSSGIGVADPYSRSYRTNFWEVKSAPGQDAATIYISQRGRDYDSPANNVLKLQLDPATLDRVLEQRLPFDEVFNVNRVYGFAQDRDTTGRFPSDFEFADLDGEPMLLVNHFRDPINFKDAPYYALTRKFLLGSRALERPSSAESTEFQASYYQLAVANSGKVLTCSFYGNALYLFDAHPRISIKDQMPIRIE